MAVLVPAPDNQAVRKAVLCIELHNATRLQNSAYLRQHPVLTVFRRQLGGSVGAPLEHEIKDNDIVGIVRIGYPAIVSATGKIDVF